MKTKDKDISDRLHTDALYPELDYNAVGHFRVGYSEGFSMIHLCAFHRYEAAYRYVSLYVPDMLNLVLLINMVQPDHVSIAIKSFPGGKEWKRENEPLDEGDFSLQPGDTLDNVLADFGITREDIK